MGISFSQLDIHLCNPRCFRARPDNLALIAIFKCNTTPDMIRMMMRQKNMR